MTPEIKNYYYRAGDHCYVWDNDTDTYKCDVNGDIIFCNIIELRGSTVYVELANLTPNKCTFNTDEVWKVGTGPCMNIGYDRDVTNVFDQTNKLYEIEIALLNLSSVIEELNILRSVILESDTDQAVALLDAMKIMYEYKFDTLKDKCSVV